MTAPFTASNGMTVEASDTYVLAVGNFQVTALDRDRLRALVEYAASIGITAKLEGYMKPPKPPAPVKNSGIGNIYRGQK